MTSEKCLVDLNSVIELLEHEWGFEGMREDLCKLPTVDAVEVVRCKDCKRLYHGNYCMRMSVVVKPDDFCSYGERKDNEV